MTYYPLHDENFQIKSIFNDKMPQLKIKEIDDSINSKSKALCPSNIWNDNIDYDINYSHHAIPIKNAINIKHCDV